MGAGSEQLAANAWSQYMAPQGIPYYHNRITGKSHWRLPPGAVLEQDEQQRLEGKDPHHLQQQIASDATKPQHEPQLQAEYQPQQQQQTTTTTAPNSSTQQQHCQQVALPEPAQQAQPGSSSSSGALERLLLHVQQQINQVSLEQP